MTEQYNVVPWYNSAEWHSVYEQLYSDKSNKGAVLKQLLIWKARSPSLPSGIESTLTLLQVYIQHQNSSSDMTSEQILRLAYSSAIMRFVNHMLDTETAKGSSLYRAANNLGVPDWIIDLRHETAHSNKLPSLQLLSDATVIGLEWLRKNYWEKHKSFLQDYIAGQTDDSAIENRIALFMNFCISLSVCAHPKCNIQNLSAIPNPSMKMSIIKDAKELFGDQIDVSNMETISIKSLINTINHQSGRLFKNKLKNATLYVNKSLLEDDSLFLSVELLKFLDDGSTKKKYKLNRSYVQCFGVLLTYLHANELLLDFILGLIKITQTENINKHKALLGALWVSEILCALKSCRDFRIKINTLKNKEVSNKINELKKLYHHWYPDEETNLILDLKKPIPSELTDISFIKPIISSYNKYLTYFVNDLLNLLDPLLPTIVSEKICKLAKLISSPEKFPIQSMTKIYTENDLKSSGSFIKTSVEINNSSEEELNSHNQSASDFITGVWKIASGKHNWAACPIGQLPFASTARDDLQIHTDVEMET